MKVNQNIYEDDKDNKLIYKNYNINMEMTIIIDH